MARVRDVTRSPGLRWLVGILAFVVLAVAAIAAVLWAWDQRSTTVSGDDQVLTVEDPGVDAPPVVEEPEEEEAVIEEVRTDEPWPLFGRTPTRASLAAEVDLPPPLKELWRLEGDRRIRASPVVSYGRLYSVSENGGVLALDVESGQVLWENELGRCVDASPAVSDQVVYVPLMDPAPCRRHARRAAGFLVALDATTGEELWRFEAGLVESAPVIAGGRVYVGSWDGNVYALDAKSGEEVWSSSTDERIRGGVSVRQGLVFVGSFDTFLYAFSARDGALLWTAGASGGFSSTPTAVRGQVLAGNTDTNLYSFDAETGLLRWSVDTDGVVYGSPAIWLDTAYATSFDGTVYAIDLESGTSRWTTDTGASITGSASVIGGIVYVPTTDRRTLALDGATGQELWSFGDGRRAQMITDGERLFLAGDRIIYGLEPDPDTPLEPVEPAAPPPEPPPETVAPEPPPEPAPAPPPVEQPPAPAPEPAPEPPPEPPPPAEPPPPEETPTPDPPPAEGGAAASG